MQKKMLFFAGIIVCLLIISATGFYWYHKPRSNLINVTPAYQLSATELYTAFNKNEKKANQQFLEKVIEVTGEVDNMQVTDSTVSILLSSGNEMGGVNCSVSKAKNLTESLPSKGSVIQVKGRCIGYLMDVNLVDVIIEK